MQVYFELRELHRVILAALYLGGVQPLDEELVAASLKLLDLERFDYIELLRKITWNKVYWSTTQTSPGADDFSDADVAEAITTLAALELIDIDLMPRSYEGSYRLKTKTGRDGYEVGLTEEGVRVATAILEDRRAIVRPPRDRRSTIFVASAFGYEDLDALFELVLKPVCKELGYSPFRVDMSEPVQTITDRVLQGIRDCRCMIADLTFARPSVYFEVGVAHGLGIPLVLTCRTDHYRNSGDQMRVHFDLEQYKISFWKRDQNGQFIWSNLMSPSDRLKSILEMRSREI